MSKRYDTSAVNTWCPGCGNFSILNVVKQTLGELNIEPWDAVAVTGIGCHGKFTDYIGVNGIHTIHGRVLPVATAIKLRRRLQYWDGAFRPRSSEERRLDIHRP